MINQDSQNIKFDILKQIELFSYLTENELLELARISILCKYKKGTIVYREGDVPKYLYIIGKGRIRSFCSSLSGRIINEDISNDLIGVSNFFTGDPREQSAECVDNVTVLEVGRVDFFSFIKNKPELVWRFLIRSHQKLTIVINRLNAYIDSSAEQKVIDILYGLNKKSGVAMFFNLEEISNLGGITRETTARVTSQLKKSGIVETSHKGIRIIDINRLKNLRQYDPII
jgi:CRP-like cAMP-binding protein